MITIMPADEAFLAEISAPAGADALVLRNSTGTVEGHALFRLAGDAVEILQVVTEEPLMTEGLIRSVLNAGDYRGAVTGICRVAALEPVLRRLEFVPDADGDGWCISIAAFFRGKCPGEK